MASISSAGYTAPVGLEGETNIRALVAGVRASSSWSTVTRKPDAVSVDRGTAVPPARAMDSG